MFYLLTLACFFASIAFVAKLNKSNKLFWTLCVSGLLGLAAGSYYHGVGNHDEKKEKVSHVYPMQAFDSGCSVHNISIPNCVSENNITVKNTFVYITKPAGKDNIHVSEDLTSRTLQTFNPEDDIGVIEPVNTS